MFRTPSVALFVIQLNYFACGDVWPLCASGQSAGCTFTQRLPMKTAPSAAACLLFLDFYVCEQVRRIAQLNTHFHIARKERAIHICW